MAHRYVARGGAAAGCVAIAAVALGAPGCAGGASAAHPRRTAEPAREHSAAGGARPDPADGANPSADAAADTASSSRTEPPSPLEGEGSRTAFVDARFRYLVRVELAQVRGTPLEPEVRRLLRAIPRWRRVMDATGLDPIEHIDRLFVASPTRRSPYYLVLARHDAGKDRLRALVSQLADDAGREAQWTQREGADVAPWLEGDGPERSIVVLREQWVAVAPRSEVPRLLQVARRGAQAELAEGEPMPWSMDQPLSTRHEAGLLVEGREPGRGEKERPHSPRSFEAVGRVDGEGNVTCTWRGRYDDAEAARAAREHWDARRRSYADNALISMLGLGGPIASAQWTLDAPELRLRLELTLDEMSQLIRFATPIVVGSGKR